MPRVSLLAILLLGSLTFAQDDMSTTLYRHTLKDIDGKEVALSRFEGKVLLIVNTASECGYTPQYTGLQELHEKYAERGLVVLGVPCNDFGGQEPGSAEEIKTFCTTRYKVAFPLLEKVKIAKDPHPLYAQLTTRNDDPRLNGPVKWNFTKFLVDRAGKVVGRFESKVAPGAKELTEAVERELAKPAPAKQGDPRDE